MDSRPEVLIVEANPAVARLLCRILQQEGHVIASAADGAAALSLLEQAAPEVVLLEGVMPVREGCAWAHRLHERAGGRAPTLVFAANDVGAHAGDIPPDDVFRKPFELGDLVLRLRRLLPRGGGTRRSRRGNGKAQRRGPR